MAYKTTNAHQNWLASLAWQGDGWARVACLASNISPTGSTALSVFTAAEVVTSGYVRSPLSIPVPFTVNFDTVQGRSECPAIKAGFAAPDGPIDYDCLFILATKAGQPDRVEGFVNFPGGETIPMGRTREFTIRYNVAGGNAVDVEVE